MRQVAVLAGPRRWFVGLPPGRTPAALRVLTGPTYFGCHDKAVRELGFSARPLDEGMAQTIEHELRVLGRAWQT